MFPCSICFFSHNQSWINFEIWTRTTHGPPDHPTPVVTLTFSSRENCAICVSSESQLNLNWFIKCYGRLPIEKKQRKRFSSRRIGDIASYLALCLLPCFGPCGTKVWKNARINLDDQKTWVRAWRATKQSLPQGDYLDLWQGSPSLQHPQGQEREWRRCWPRVGLWAGLVPTMRSRSSRMKRKDLRWSRTRPRTIHFERQPRGEERERRATESWSYSMLDKN